jgi:hypothetical protein
MNRGERERMLKFHREAAQDPFRTPRQRVFHAQAAQDCRGIIKRARRARGAFFCAGDWNRFCEAWRDELQRVAQELQRARHGRAQARVQLEI